MPQAMKLKRNCGLSFGKFLALSTRHRKKGSEIKLRSHSFAAHSKTEFHTSFMVSCTKSGYEELDERKRLTAAKMEELLLVLEHPELPLHNNPAELGARTMVLRRNISYGTQTSDGTKAWDTFLSLVATTRKLGISFFEYVRVGAARLWHRITGTENIESNGNDNSEQYRS
jgi:hypothetical protein